MTFIPTILSGGAGTRLWPVSRTHFPKQFCDIFDESLFKKTLVRVKQLGSPWVITNAALKIQTETVLREVKTPFEQALYEPKANNTAPAIAFLCKVLELQGRAQDIVGTFHSDHLIQNEKAFQDAVKLGIECAKKKQVATLGIKPTFPATGFGYIEVEKAVFLEQDGIRAHPTLGFREKPNEQMAEDFIQQGNFFWNAGMFIFEVQVMIQHFKTLMPDLWKVMDTLKPDLSNLKDVYARSPSQSIDFGIMEHLKSQVCIPCDIGWSDIGSWDEIANLTENADIIEVGGSKNFAYSRQNRVISFVDVYDLIVVDTPDALLITKRDRLKK